MYQKNGRRKMNTLSWPIKPLDASFPQGVAESLSKSAMEVPEIVALNAYLSDLPGKASQLTIGIEIDQRLTVARYDHIRQTLQGSIARDCTPAFTSVNKWNKAEVERVSQRIYQR